MRKSRERAWKRMTKKASSTHPWIPYTLIRCWKNKLGDSYKNRIVKAHHPLKDRRMLKFFCKIPKINNLMTKSNFTRMVTQSILNTFLRNNVCCNVLIKINENPSWTSFLYTTLGSFNQSSILFWTTMSCNILIKINKNPLWTSFSYTTLGSLRARPSPLKVFENGRMSEL